MFTVGGAVLTVGGAELTVGIIYYCLEWDSTPPPPFFNMAFHRT